MELNEDVVLVDIMTEVVASMRVDGISSETSSNILFLCGRTFEIIGGLMKFDESITYKDKKYPLIAMLMPVIEQMGDMPYSIAKIDRMVIATITDSDDTIQKRYNTGGTYKAILYPCYNEFRRRLAWHPLTGLGDLEAFVHTKVDNPGIQPVGQGLVDYVDCIDLLNLEIPLTQIKNCKQ